MAEMPLQVMRVSDPEAVRDFLMRVAEQVQGVVALRDENGLPVLLVSETAADPAPYLARALVTRQPGDTVSLRSRGLDAEAARLAGLGYTDATRERRSWGDEVLTVRGPDSYAVAFVHRPERSPDEWMEMYTRGPEVLDEALDGLSEGDFDLTPEHGGWSIRQITHHVVEGDDVWALPLKVALARPGALYRQDWYTPDNAWADLLDYAHRPVGPALEAFRATRAYMTELLRHFGPEVVWTRSVMYSWPNQQEPYPVSVRGIVEPQAVHVFMHADEIQAIRQTHGK